MVVINVFLLVIFVKLSLNVLFYSTPAISKVSRDILRVTHYDMQSTRTLNQHHKGQHIRIICLVNEVNILTIVKSRKRFPCYVVFKNWFAVLTENLVE